MARLRRAYGAGPLHLIAVLAAVAIAGYAFLEIAERPAPLSFLVFFAGAIVAHDLIAFPIYSALDRLAGGVAAAAGGGSSAVNYVRVPALLSAFALIVWFPLILGLDRDNYEAAAGIAPPDFLGRWLVLTAVLFLGSGLLLALRLRRLGRGRDRATDHPGPRSRR